MIDMATINKYNVYMSWKMKFKIKAWWRCWGTAVQLFLVLMGFVIFASMDALIARWF